MRLLGPPFPIGVELHPQKTVSWDALEEPESGVIVIGLPLGGQYPSSEHAAKFSHGVGPSSFIYEQCLTKIFSLHVDALEKLRELLRHAPKGRDVGTTVERLLRLCVIPCHIHIARVFPSTSVHHTLKKSTSSPLSLPRAICTDGTRTVLGTVRMNLSWI